MIKLWHSRSFSKKLIFFITVLMLVSSLVIGIFSYIVARNALIEKGKISLKNGVKSAIFLIDHYQNCIDDGLVDVATAQELVKETLLGPMNPDGTRRIESELDFGENGYYIVYDKLGNEVMHPTLEGVNVWHYIDKANTGVPYYFVQDKIFKAQNGGGYTEYTWEYPFSDKLGKKIVYSEIDNHWGWIVTAGSYVSDFDAAAIIILRITILTIIIVLFIGYQTSKAFIISTTRPITRVVDAMKIAETGAFSKVITQDSRDEIGKLTWGFNSLIDAIETAQKNLIKKDDQLLKYAYYDTLSGLPNAYYFKATVSERMEKTYSSAALFLVDIKDFNFINSIYGTAYGDRVIQFLGSIIAEAKFKDTLIARVGGNEFAAWIENIDSNTIDESIANFVEDLKEALVKQNFNAHFEFYISKVIMNPHEEKRSFDTLYKMASTALQFAKNNKQTSISTYTEEMYAKLERESIMIHHAEQAVKNRAFSLYYQSKVDSRTDRITGVECLARWHSTELGFVSPGEFIPILYKANLMNEFSRMIIEMAIADLDILSGKFGADLSVSINIPPTLFYDDDFVSFMEKSISKVGIKADRIILEITEDIFITDFEMIIGRIEAIRSMGIKLSLDDFGTGYSSLNYLTKIQFDEIKVDKSFIDHIMTEPKAYTLFKSIVDIAHAMNSIVIAEGVESMSQVDMIKKAGCFMIQGYVYAIPAPIEEL